MTQKQIVDAQKLLRKLESTPVKFYNESGIPYWQVTYDNDTYNALLGIISDIARTPLYTQTQFELGENYHREKV